MIGVVLSAIVFGAAAWIGVLLARVHCAGIIPFEDGPVSIAVQPWVIVLAGASVGVGAFEHQPSALQLLTLGVVVIALAAVTHSDFSLGIVPDVFSLIPLAVLIIISAIQHHLEPLVFAFVVATPFAAAAVLTHGRGMGWGDVKLAALGGALIGPQASIFALMLASVAALIASRMPALRGRPIAFAPYIAGGIGTMLAFGSRL